MKNFDFSLSICLFFVSLLNFKAYIDVGDVKNGLLSIVLLGAAFHTLSMASQFAKKEVKENDNK